MAHRQPLQEAPLYPGPSISGSASASSDVLHALSSPGLLGQRCWAAELARGLSKSVIVCVQRWHVVHGWGCGGDYGNKPAHSPTNVGMFVSELHVSVHTWQS